MTLIESLERASDEALVFDALRDMLKLIPPMWQKQFFMHLVRYQTHALRTGLWYSHPPSRLKIPQSIT